MHDLILQSSELREHTGWITQLITCTNNPDLLLSSSRDKTVLIWKLTHDVENYAVPVKRLCGHSGFVSDIALSADGNYALTSSWDKTVKLWDLEKGRIRDTFRGHNKDVLSVAFSPDNRQIVSASRDKTIKLWNTLAQCKYTINQEDSMWISCIRFFPNCANPVFLSSGWDGTVKTWSLTNWQLISNQRGHDGFVNTVTVSPDGSLWASGGRDGNVLLWDASDNKHLHTLDHSDTVSAMCFNPTRYWLSVAYGSHIRVWDLDGKTPVTDLILPVPRRNGPEPTTIRLHPRTRYIPQCTAMAWSNDGQTLFAGYDDNTIRIWRIYVACANN